MKDETATSAMLEQEVLTPDFQKQFTEAVTPTIAKFQKTHPLIAITYKFNVEITDGLTVAYGGYAIQQKKQIKALKHLAALKLRKELAQQHSRSPGGGSPRNPDGGRDCESRDTRKACDTAVVPQV
jgi:hypothetical protein